MICASDCTFSFCRIVWVRQYVQIGRKFDEALVFLNSKILPTEFLPSFFYHTPKKSPVPKANRSPVSPKRIKRLPPNHAPVIR